MSMEKEEKLRIVDKRLHRVLLIILKVLPMACALCFCLNSFLSYFNLYAGIMSHLAGMSLFTWVFIYIASFVFKFCAYHRMFLYYILVDDLVCYYDYYIGIPVNNFDMLTIHNVIAGVFLFLILYLYCKHGRKNRKNNKEKAQIIQS